jgi:hypothetical protein
MITKMFRFFSIVSVVIAVAISCEESPCTSLNCNASNAETGICNEVSGTCICIDGWQTGSNGICAVEWTEKFVGLYSVSDTCYGSSPDTTIVYPVTIVSTSPETLTFSNLGNKNQLVKATHTNSTTFTVSDTISNGIILRGTGVLVDTTLVLSYILNDSINGNGLDTCVATFN